MNLITARDIKAELDTRDEELKTANEKIAD